MISIVVATHDRAALLPRLVGALEKQDAGLGSELEVVIVDDGSRDDTPAVLRDLAATSHLDLRVERLPVSRGPAAARNVGWRAASGTIVAFTDDDCVPDRGWLSALVAGARAADVVQGRTLPDPAQADAVGPFSRTVEVTSEDGYYQTCNIAYRRDVLERVGGFDERLTHSGEDTDLAWRARDAGAVTRFAPDALVLHDVRPSSLLVQLRDTTRWDGVVLCTRLHPGLRAMFHRRWFWKASHPPALLAAAGVVGAVATRRVAPLALVAPYVRHRIAGAPLRGGPRRRVAAIPGALVADLAEVAVLAAASARHRTVLL